MTRTVSEIKKILALTFGLEGVDPGVPAKVYAMADAMHDMLDILEDLEKANKPVVTKAKKQSIFKRNK